MDFLDFSHICDALEGTAGRLDMTSIVQDVLPKLDEEDIPLFIRYLMGRPFPDWSPQKIGIGPNSVYDAVAYVAGRDRRAVVAAVNRSGDPGRAVEELLAKKEQMSFFSESLTLTEIGRDFTLLAATGGTKSQKEKDRVLRRLFGNASPLEGRYLARLLLGELRIGIGEGTMRDAIAGAFGVNPAAVEHAHQAANDLGEVALLARTGEDALYAVHIEPFRPVKMMLAKQGTVTDMLREAGTIAAEYKYDGTRFQFHKSGGVCRMYSRRLEEVTHAIPDVVAMLDAATPHDIILDGEVIAVRDGRPLPFQYVLRRFRRKHNVDSHIEEITLAPNIFDILWVDGETLIDLPFTERRKRLEAAVSDTYVAPQLVSGDEDEIAALYRRALEEGHEGIMIKDPRSPYTPGVRGKLWVKIKPAVDTIDLVVTGAEWGEGKRAHIFGSFLLSCLGEDGSFIPLSKVATGFSDEALQEMYAALSDLVISEEGKMVRVEPQIVVEVGYAEIQKSPNYTGGFALRFPRFIRMRDDKSPEEIESLRMIEERFAAQSAR
ncbi:ATP-dependent DNA ligase [Methanogenium organophilum]|uniref:DNA ligase n=1 Tax=Methanogenium organophilum TaxID=2199 RepID=A0A9X9T9E4_METOG|nr:ATP-dependent DNA ligase [Methanogenium organophilum]WAI02022.1 ATP-dependent DNA ligase [Methanogenium organophilum]